MEKWPIDEGPKYAMGWYEFDHPSPDHAKLPLLFPLTKILETQIFIGLYRLDAEVRLCELFDQLPLEGKEEYADA